MKRRKEKFNPTNDTTMVEKIEERSKKDREASEEVIASEEPLPATTRNFFESVFMCSCQIDGGIARAPECQDRDVAKEPNRGC